MKYLIPTLLFLFFDFVAFAQCDAVAFGRLMSEAQQFAESGNYETAVKKLSAAMIVCPDSATIPQKELVRIFDKIENLKTEAAKKEFVEQQRKKVMTFLKQELETKGITADNLFDYFRKEAKKELDKGLYNDAINDYNRTMLLAETEQDETAIKPKLQRTESLRQLLKEAGELNARRDYAGAIKKYNEILQINPTDTITPFRVWFAKILQDGYMVTVPGGKFIMGDSINGEVDEKPEHLVKLDTFCMARYEVTQELYQGVMGTNPSHFRDSLQNPVEQVSWYEAVEFCYRLSLLMGLTPCYKINKNVKDPDNDNPFDDLKWQVKMDSMANGFRLPTEAEWEFAARGASTGSAAVPRQQWAGTNDVNELKKYACYDTTGTIPVGRLLPNELGLYDMSGNVWEWCWDWYADDYYQQCQNQGTVLSPFGPQNGAYRILRGGAWYDDADNCRMADRLNFNPHFGWINCGFRLVLGFQFTSEPGKASR